MAPVGMPCAFKATFTTDKYGDLWCVTTSLLLSELDELVIASSHQAESCTFICDCERREYGMVAAMPALSVRLSFPSDLRLRVFPPGSTTVAAARAKLAMNALKYPVDKARGHSRKYNET